MRRREIGGDWGRLGRAGEIGGLGASDCGETGVDWRDRDGWGNGERLEKTGGTEMTG